MFLYPVTAEKTIGAKLLKQTSKEKPQYTICQRAQKSVFWMVLFLKQISKKR